MFVFRPHLFAGEEDMNAAARPAFGPVDEQIHVEQLMIDKARCLQCGSRRGEVSPTDQNIEIACAADSSFVGAGDPLGNRITPEFRD